jgi:murein DD-endopeptidase MepM/ murein hydrolase activator NlpD
MEATQRTGLMRWSAGAVFLLLAACAMPADADPDEQQAAAPVVELPAPAVAEPPAIVEQVQSSAAEPALTNRIDCAGPATQGGAILCRADPGSVFALDGKPIAVADREGLAVIGLSRSQASPAVIGFVATADRPLTPERASFNAVVEVKPRKDTVSKFEMECAVIAPQSPADQRKAEVSWVKKDNALKTFSEPLAPVAFARPVAEEFRFSSPFGATRTYVPKTKDCEGRTSVHNGADFAVPTGTEIRAPMAGTVVLADPDLFYEGGCVFLDLGRGLVSVTMHMSRIDVKAGDRVEQGEVLGLSGATGRVTGPHLHWAIKYRNVLSADRGTDIWLDPVLMMGLAAPAAP